MNREQFVRAVADREGIPQGDVGKILDALLSMATLSLSAGEAVNIRGFGVLESRVNSPTRRRVPGKGMIDVPEKTTVVFRASPVLKRRLNGKKTCEDTPSTSTDSTGSCGVGPTG